MSSAVVGLVILLVAYSLVGLTLGLNIGRVADRAAAHHRRHPWGLPMYNNPNSWRGFGLVGVAFGVTILGWMALEATH